MRILNSGEVQCLTAQQSSSWFAKLEKEPKYPAPLFFASYLHWPGV